MVFFISAGQDVNRYFILKILITGIHLQFIIWIFPFAIIWEKFLEFVEIISHQIISLFKQTVYNEVGKKGLY